MFSRLKSHSLIKDSAVYVICDGINRGLPFLVLPIIVRFLTPTDYGIVTNYAVLTQIIQVIVIWAAQGSITVNFYRMDKPHFVKYLSTIVTIAVILFLLFLGLVACFHNPLQGLLSLPESFLILCVVEVIAAVFILITLQILRCEEKPMLFGVVQISQTLISLGLTLYFVIALSMAWQGKIIAGFISHLVVSGGCLVFLFKRGYLLKRFYLGYSRMVISFALPLVPHAIALWGKSSIDKVLISNILGLGVNGLYSVALTWVSIVSMFLFSFFNAFGPYILKKLAYFDKNKHLPDIYQEQCKLVKLTYIIMGAIALFVTISYVVSYWLIIWIYPSEYHGSVSFLPFLMLGEFFRGCYLMYVNYIHYTLNTKALGAITFSLFIAQIGLSYILLIKVGAIGASISSAIASFLTFVGVAWYAMQVYKLPWNLSPTPHQKQA